MAKTTLKQKLALIGLGILFTLIVLEIFLRLGAGLFLFIQEQRNQKGFSRNNTYIILCLGESTTALGGENAYPYQLEQILNQKNLSRKFKVINRGIPAINSKTILNKINDNLDRYKPDLVVSMIGINDHWHTKKLKVTLWQRVAIFLENFRVYKLFNLSISHLRHKLDEMKIVKYYETPYEAQYDALAEKDFKQQMSNHGLGGADLTQKHSEPYEKTISKIHDFEQLRNVLILEKAKLDQLGKVEEAQDISKKQYFVSLRLYVYLVGAGFWNRERGNFQLAQEFCERAIVLLPNKVPAYLELGRIYKDQQHYEKAIAIFLKIIEMTSQEPNAFLELGRSCEAIGDYEKTAKAYKILLDTEGLQDWIYLEVAQWYDKKKLWSFAEQAYKKVLANSPGNLLTYDRLGDIYIQQNRLSEAQALLEDAIKKNEKEEISYQRPILYKKLAEVLEKEGKTQAAGEYVKKSQEFVASRYLPQTVQNYNDTVNQILKRNIPVIVMQYPMRALDPLKETFVNKNKIIFLENKKNFEEALHSSSYADYFQDNFAGDFGHCTRKGNLLIAENLAETIVQKLLK